MLAGFGWAGCLSYGEPEGYGKLAEGFAKDDFVVAWFVEVSDAGFLLVVVFEVEGSGFFEAAETRGFDEENAIALSF